MAFCSGFNLLKRKKDYLEAFGNYTKRREMRG